MLAPIIEEEEGEVEKDFQNKTISEKVTSSDIDQDPLEDHNTSEEEDEDVVIVDPGEKVRNVLEHSANMMEEEEKQNHSGPEGGSSRQLQESDDYLEEIYDTEIIWCRMKNTDDNEEEMTFSVNKDNVIVESSSESEIELYNRQRSQIEPSTSPIIIPMEPQVEEESPETSSWTSVFNWDDFGYSLILGFAPTAWDVYSDLTIANYLTSRGDNISAGLSYLFICFPGLYVLSEILTEKLSRGGNWVMVGNFCWSVSLSSAMIYTFSKSPLFFKYPAYLIGSLVVITKGLAIFIHTPEMKRISNILTEGEFKTEAPLQLLMLLHLWVSGGPLFHTPILSSLLVLGKVNAEIYLADEPDDLMKGKSFLQKFTLTLKYVPLFSSTAFFRVGCGIIKHSGPYAAFSDTFHAFVFFFSVCSGTNREDFLNVPSHFPYPREEKNIRPTRSFLD